jgi:hypothetical protein
MADLSTTSEVINYLGNGVQYPNIKSGTKFGDISLLTRSDLTSLGLNFGQFGADPPGNYVFGFSFDELLVPEGKFTAHVFFECMNNGEAIQGINTPDVTIQTINAPEPGSLVLWGIGGAILAGWAASRRAKGGVRNRLAS